MAILASYDAADETSSEIEDSARISRLVCRTNFSQGSANGTEHFLFSDITISSLSVVSG